MFHHAYYLFKKIVNFFVRNLHLLTNLGVGIYALIFFIGEAYNTKTSGRLENDFHNMYKNYYDYMLMWSIIFSVYTFLVFRYIKHKKIQEILFLVFIALFILSNIHYYFHDWSWLAMAFLESVR